MKTSWIRAHFVHNLTKIMESIDHFLHFQPHGSLASEKMFDHEKLEQSDSLKIKTIIRLSRFVTENRYFPLGRHRYHQIRGGAMHSLLTLTMTNCDMFFFKRVTTRQ